MKSNTILKELQCREDLTPLESNYRGNTEGDITYSLGYNG